MDNSERIRSDVKMKSSPHHQEPEHFEAEYLQYLTPGSFTVLPPEGCSSLPSPPKAPEPNKLTPVARRRRNQAFAIIAEPNSASSSRSGSPTGRVSPFRGRGFNPTGSRHASPAPSPTPPLESPDKSRLSSKSQIPKMVRRRSSAEDILTTSTPKREMLQMQRSARTQREPGVMYHSKSMTTIVPRHLASKPPPTPRRTNLKPSFVRLSPIIGSSPESSDQVQSSPSRIPKSKSQPGSRFSSPTRNVPPAKSPKNKSPTKIPMKNSAYKNIPAKIDSFNKTQTANKPKVPQKPKVIATANRTITRSSSIRKIAPKSQELSNNNNNNKSTIPEPGPEQIETQKETTNESNNNNNNKPSTSKNGSNSTSISKITSTLQNASKLKRTDTSKSLTTKTQNQKKNGSTISKQDTGAKQSQKTRNIVEDESKDDDILSVTIDNFDGLLSTTQVVTATTETVTKPLNIEAKLIKQSEIVNQNVKSTATTNPPNPTITRANNSSNKAPNSNRANIGPEVTQEFVNNNVTRAMNVLNSLETSRNSYNNLTPPDSDKVTKTLIDTSHLTNSANEKLRQARTVIVPDEIKPIKITVREKSGDMEVQSGNYALPRTATNGITERPLVPPPNSALSQTESQLEETKKKSTCSKLFPCFQKNKDSTTPEDVAPQDRQSNANETEKPSCWTKLNCCKRSKCCKSGRCCKGNKVSDSNKTSGCFPKFKRNKDNEDNWAERRDSILSEPQPKEGCCACWKKLFCKSCCCSNCRKKPTEVEETVSRRASMLSKKKSLSSTMQLPPEKKAVKAVKPDPTPKLDSTLVEHTSLMRGAIPVLPVPLAWICLVCNVFLPGFGTILSGILCLCLGIPRFSPRDGARARIGAFIIDLLVGLSQTFTVLFCLVGWGWSVWWGVIMLKIAKKHRKIKRAEMSQLEHTHPPAHPPAKGSHSTRDIERGT